MLGRHEDVDLPWIRSCSICALIRVCRWVVSANRNGVDSASEMFDVESFGLGVSSPAASVFLVFEYCPVISRLLVIESLDLLPIPFNACSIVKYLGTPKGVVSPALVTAERRPFALTLLRLFSVGDSRASGRKIAFSFGRTATPPFLPPTARDFNLSGVVRR